MKSLQLDYNTKFNNFIDVPVRSLIFLIKKFKIFSCFNKYVRDCRAKKGTYSIASLLMVALQILLFRSPSKNDFYQNKKLGRTHAYHNLSHLAGIEANRFPHTKTLDDAFYLLNAEDLQPCLFEIFKKICSSKILSNHPTLKKTANTIC